MTEALPSIESTGGRAFPFQASDGAKLRGAVWEQPAGEPTGTALLLGGRTEFIEKNLEATEELLKRGYKVWTLDWRGQGLSQRALDDRDKGHIENYQQFLDDLALFVERFVVPEAKRPLVLLAHSMGGHISLRYLHDNPGRFAAAAFSSPMVDIQPTGLKRLAVKALANVGAALSPESYVCGTGPYSDKDRRFEGNILTSDRMRFEGMVAQIDEERKLALGGPTFGWLEATYESVATLCAPAYARAIETPILIASAGDEKIVDNAAQQRLCEHLPRGRFVTIEGALHELLIEADAYRLRFWQEVDRHLTETIG